MEREIAKFEFKKYYFKFGQFQDGWTQEYWDRFYEPELHAKYFFEEPQEFTHTRMFIISGDGVHRMIFLSEDAEESFMSSPQ